MSGLRWVVAVVLASLVAGCFGASGPDPAANLAALGDASDGASADGTADLANATRALFEAVNPWDDGAGGNVSELVIVETVLQAEPFNDWGSLGDSVYAGGASTYPREGIFLPPGTVAVRMKADVSATARHGSWGAFIGDTAAGYRWEYGNRDVEGAPTNSGTGTWEFPIRPEDWDPPYYSQSMFRSGVYAYGEPANAMRGPVAFVVTALRDPDWVPEPIEDPWPALDAALVPQEGVHRMGGGVVTTRFSASSLNAASVGDLDLERPALIGSRAVVLGVQWETPACPPAASECWVEVVVRDLHGSYHPRHANVTEYASDVDLLLYDVPRTIRPQPAEVPEEWWASLEVRGHTCAATCQEPYPGDARAKVLVEAWRADVDLDAFAARLREVT